MTSQRKALIIANDEYEQESLRNLMAPEADAVALGRVLGDAQIGGFAVQVVQNEPAHVIEARIEDLFSESRPDDVLLLHFSCHGLKSESGELFFAASNTRPNRLRATAVPADFVQRCMQDARSRSIVLLLDCCYGGAFSPGVKVRAAGDVNVLDSFPQGRLGGGRGRAVITASNAMQYAFEGDRLADDQHQRPSVFTSALVEGLATGDADRDEDGLVSLNELYDYVYDKVREQNPHQTPSRQVELEGELYLARSRRRRIRPAPIPADLKAATADPNMYARRGAMHELESRLASDDLPVAAGAYEALAELARTDIKYVADLATAALGRAAIQPEETELHFGKQRQGTESPHRVVRLLGPPLARACAPRASEDWIRVAETAGGLDISVGTTGTGVLRGRVDLNGPTGAAVINVDVELLPLAEQAPRPRRPARSADQEVVAPAVPAAQPERRPAAAGGEQTQRVAAPESTASAGSPMVRSRSRRSVTAPSPRLAFAGWLAAASAVLVFVGLPPTYMSGRYWDGTIAWFVRKSFAYMTPWWSCFIVGAAALSLTAGVCTLMRRWQSLPGVGLLLATIAAATSALAYNLSHLAASFDDGVFTSTYPRSYGSGYWLQLASSVSLILAGCLAISALARTGEVRLVRLPRRFALPQVVVLLGAVGTLALACQDFRLWFHPAGSPQLISAAVPSLLMAGWALVMPTLAVMAMPRRFGVALLWGWIWIGAAFCVFSYLFFGSFEWLDYSYRIPVIVFGLTLLALAIAAIPFARAGRRTGPIA